MQAAKALAGTAGATDVDAIARPPRVLEHSNGQRPPEQSSRVRPPRRLRGMSSLYSNCMSALQSLRVNKMRSLLTSLGIIIGVGAVIVMISIGEASAASINNRLAGLNPTELIIFPGSTSSGGIQKRAGSASTLTQADADAIATQVPN